MNRCICLLFGAMLLGACEDKAQRVFFAGNYYPSKASSSKDDREAFVVSVRKADQGLTGAREAGRYEGVKYCIKNFGSSEIDWVRGPDAKDGTLLIQDGKLILQGRCVTW